MSDEEVEVLKNKQLAVDKLLADYGAAKYKVEIMFSRDYSMQRPSVGVITFWESGAKLHGGGDSSLYLCPGKTLKRNECTKFIPYQAQGMGILICPHCHVQWKGEEAIGQLLFRLSIQKWAEVLLYYYHSLECNVDLVMKYYPGSLISATEKEQNKQQFGEQFGKVRGKRAKRVYPLSHIIKDTSSGADLYGRFLAFLKA
jgi:hypothetical protein